MEGATARSTCGASHSQGRRRVVVVWADGEIQARAALRPVSQQNGEREWNGRYADELFRIIIPGRPSPDASTADRSITDWLRRAVIAS